MHNCLHLFICKSFSLHYKIVTHFAITYGYEYENKRVLFVENPETETICEGHCCWQELLHFFFFWLYDIYMLIILSTYSSSRAWYSRQTSLVFSILHDTVLYYEIKMWKKKKKKNNEEGERGVS